MYCDFFLVCVLCGGCFNLFCNMCVYEYVWVLECVGVCMVGFFMCGCAYVWVF
jgi:hypothetical protein